MGPTIILDKSALQGLSHDEITFLGKHYSIVVPHVLLMEILGDLKKGNSDTSSEEKVQQLANKIRGLTVYHNRWYRELCIGNLLGYQVEMQHVPLVYGKRVFSEDGRPINFAEDPPEALALLNWRAGNFTAAEHDIADRWRVSTKSIDLVGFRNKYRKLDSIPEVKTIDELLNAVLQYTNSNKANTAIQKEWILDFIGDFSGTEELRRKVYARWKRLDLPCFQKFAPYAYYCFLLTQIFQLGVIRDLISTRATNRVDMEYLYYTPFAMAFCSNDNFHKALWPHLLSPNQFFTPLPELKSDLRNLCEEWRSLTDAEKEQREFDYGTRPPRNDASITHRIWEKLMVPLKPGSGNLAVRMSEEEKQAILKHVLSIKTQALKGT